MRRIGVVVLLSICIASFGYAEGDAHRQAAEKVLSLTNADKMLAPLIEQLQQVQLQQLRQMALSPEAYATAQKYVQRINDLVVGELRWQNIKEDYVGLYTAAFTEQELHQLIAFYSTPAGQKMVARMPALMQQSLQLGQQKIERIMPEIQALTEEMLQEIEQHDHGR
ncbi:MAG: DUF2059 domain-containing protein [Desulfobacterales bacterium]